MTSWIGPACVRGRGLVMVTALLAVVTVFLIPAAAEASTYRWKDAVDGVWTTAANWEHVPGSGPVGSGYPNATGDVAEFNQTYTAKRTVTIGDDVAITVGRILFDARRDVTILAEGDSSRLIVDNGAASAAEVRTISRAAGDYVLQVATVLRDALRVHADLGDTVRFAGILEIGGARSVTKAGRGFVFLGQTNGYTGARCFPTCYPTKISQGRRAHRARAVSRRTAVRARSSRVSSDCPMNGVLSMEGNPIIDDEAGPFTWDVSGT